MKIHGWDSMGFHGFIACFFSMPFHAIKACVLSHEKAWNSIAKTHAKRIEFHGKTHVKRMINP
jgi:hypothetical protein